MEKYNIFILLVFVRNSNCVGQQSFCMNKHHSGPYVPLSLMCLYVCVRLMRYLYKLQNNLDHLLAVVLCSFEMLFLAPHAAQRRSLYPNIIWALLSKCYLLNLHAKSHWIFGTTDLSLH